MDWKSYAVGGIAACGVVYLISSFSRETKKKLLLPGWEAELDRCFQEMVTESDDSDKLLTVPGVVVFAKRGEEVYSKAFGYADAESKKEMQTDAQMRCFSMTKVMTSTVTLMLIEAGQLTLETPVEDFIPSFKREVCTAETLISLYSVCVRLSPCLTFLLQCFIVGHRHRNGKGHQNKGRVRILPDGGKTTGEILPEKGSKYNVSEAPDGGKQRNQLRTVV